MGNREMGKLGEIDAGKVQTLDKGRDVVIA